MSETVSCQCGARVRLPQGGVGRSFRCPRCKAELVTMPVPGVVLSSSTTAGAHGASCPICQSTIAEAEEVLTCSDCRQMHHRECWVEVGGCGTYGCKQAPASNKEAQAELAPRAAWGDTKQCPACKESIKAIALRCRYCGTDFSTVDPLSVSDLRDQAEQSVAQRGARATVIVLFAFNIIGILAPLMLIINLAWVLPNRRLLARSGPFYTVLGYSSIVVSVVYSILILAFVLLSNV